MHPSYLISLTQRSPYYGKLPKPAVHTSFHNLSCGDKINIYLLIKRTVIVDGKFTAKGCIVSKASTALLIEYLKGKKIGALRTLTRQKFLTILGFVPSPAREKCAFASFEALQSLKQKLKYLRYILVRSAR
ncbi:MAG: iron-sulfur cluster assembly scaffold protein [Parcubacteria group bacterium]|nr:iron-sulfur cluster assembly scaffold protein [Parcubacteria group bacterium]